MAFNIDNNKCIFIFFKQGIEKIISLCIIKVTELPKVIRHWGPAERKLSFLLFKEIK